MGRNRDFNCDNKALLTMGENLTVTELYLASNTKFND